MSDKRQELDIEGTAKDLQAEGEFFPGAGQQAQEQPKEKPEDPVKAYGIGLKVSEWKKLEKIAAELGIKRHAVALWALRDFIKRYESGEIQTVTQKKLPGL